MPVQARLGTASSGMLMAKWGNIKRQHGRVEGLDELLDRILRECPHITRIVPGRIGLKKGNTPPRLRVQYPTAPGGGAASGLKCIYTRSGVWQEVFLVCADVAGAQTWLLAQSFTQDPLPGNFPRD